MTERVAPWAVVCVGDTIRGADGLSYLVDTVTLAGNRLEALITTDQAGTAWQRREYHALVRPEAAVTILERGEVGQVVDLFIERGIIAEVIEISAEPATGQGRA